jgi:hypothetical protein
MCVVVALLALLAITLPDVAHDALSVIPTASCRYVIVKSRGLVKFITFIKDVVVRDTKRTDPETVELISASLLAISAFSNEDRHGDSLRDGGAPETVCAALAHPDVNVVTKALRALLLLLKDRTLYTSLF